MKPYKIKMLAMPVAIAVLAACVSSASAGQDSTANSDPAVGTAEAFVTALNNADLDALVGTFACERAPAVHDSSPGGRSNTSAFQMVTIAPPTALIDRAARTCSTCAAENLLQELRPR